MLHIHTNIFSCTVVYRCCIFTPTFSVVQEYTDVAGPPHAASSGTFGEFSNLSVS